jgi:uroporphyrin-III C-methyltransferase/precorrin-2 dehydrogenase/sirohydrochlorin ferrochelatase
LDFLPIALDIRGRPCLVVGGGDVAARKVELLRQAQGEVTVVAPQLCAKLGKLAANAAIVHIGRAYQSDDLRDPVIVVAATDDEVVNHRVAIDAKARRIPVNVVDRPQLCTFTMPSIVDRSPVVVAVSTGGASPVLARLLRARLESFVPAGFGRLATLLSEFRAKARQRFPDTQSRRRFWEEVVSGPVAEMVLGGQDERARALLNQSFETDTPVPGVGEVYLVGAGPGDPDLLTFRALRLMQRAEVVLHDRLVAAEILALCRRDAEFIYVGKHRAVHAMRQEDINQTLAQLAKKGKRVLRLKGGDPFVFGRGGEEIDTLAQEGIPFQVVPGITAAAGCASYAGIPLTHRDYAQSVLFVTGQLKDGTVDLNWPALVQPKQTLCVYMGLAAADIICRSLITHGMASDMPVALIEQGTTSSQRVRVGTLATLPSIIAQHSVHAPTLLIIGQVVRLHEKLAWFHR